MARKRASPKVKKSVARLGKRAQVFAERLKVLRELTDRFDAKSLDRVYIRKPRTESGKKARAAALQKVSREWRTVKWYLQSGRSYKIMRPRRDANFRRNLEELRKYAGFVKIRGLRGVPIETYMPKKTRVKFDRDGRPTIVMGHSAQKFFRLDHMPYSGDDLVAQVKALLPVLPEGAYILATRHHFLFGGAAVFADRDSLVEEVTRFVEQYSERGAGMIKLVFGLKWVAGSGERAMARRKAMATERGRLKQMRADLKAERAARAVRDMHYRFTRTRLPVTQAEKNRQTRIAENIKQGKEVLEPIATLVKRKTKVSKRARATGRR